jgi:hypothetical protein
VRLAGASPAGARARRPVAWIAGWRETETLKPIDKAIRGMVSESPGRNASERELAPKDPNPGGRAVDYREQRMCPRIRRRRDKICAVAWRDAAGDPDCRTGAGLPGRAQLLDTDENLFGPGEVVVVDIPFHLWAAPSLDDFGACSKPLIEALRRIASPRAVGLPGGRWIDAAAPNDERGPHEGAHELRSQQAAAAIHYSIT